jgi:transposase
MWYKPGRVNAFTAVAVSPQRKHVALYAQFYRRTLRGEEVVGFLKPLLRHLRGPVVLLWDRGPIHRRQLVQDFLHRHPRIHAEYFPAYAPELNPAEYVWNRVDDALAKWSVSQIMSGLGCLGITWQLVKRGCQARLLTDLFVGLNLDQ